MYFVIGITPGPRVKIYRQLKAVVLFVWLCGFYYMRFMLSLALLLVFVLFYLISLALWSPRLGNRELVYMLLVYVFVYFECIDLCPSSLPVGVRGWLWLVIVALPGPFYWRFDMVWHEALWTTTRKYNTNDSCSQPLATTETEACLLSPTLFNILLERIMMTMKILSASEDDIFKTSVLQRTL